MLVVAFNAARAEGVLTATMTSTLARTRSAASDRNCSSACESSPLNDQVLTLDVAELAQPVTQACFVGRVCLRSKDPDAGTFRLSTCDRTAKHEDEYNQEAGQCLSHRITSSALRRIDSGTVRCSVFAAFRLTISSNFVGCSIGRSPGLAPFRILTTYVALRLNMSCQSTE
jgi:hypothetical protein